MERAFKTVRTWLPPAVLLAGMGVAWEIWVRAFDVPSYLLPPPSQIWTAFGEVSRTLPPNVWTTFAEAFYGLVVGSFAGALIASLLWASGLARRSLYPLLVTSQTIPMVVLAPLLVLWFGLGLTPKVVVVGLVTFFPVTVATVQGLSSTNSDLVDMLRTMGGKRAKLMRLAYLPSAAPAFFSGLRIAASYSVASAVFGEWVGASSGIGLLATRAQKSFRVDRVFVAVGVIALLSVALFALVNLLARLAMPWHHESKKL